MRGRKPKPTKQKELAGNPGKRALNKQEPQPSALTAVDAPGWLDDTAREAWGWYAPRLIQTKVLTEIDLHNLAAFCMAYSRWRQGETEIQQYGITLRGEYGTSKNPAVTVVNEALKQLATFGALLGLDPSSRSRIAVPGAPQGNPFGEF